jgi:DNA-directed RNA polymerase subunit RPC12/RpoP
MPTASYKCPNCGGALRFIPDIQKNKCEYCLSEFTNEDLERISESMEKAASERASAEARADAAAGAETQNGAPADAVTAGDAAPADASSLGSRPLKGYVCDSCGAEVVTDATTSATFCYYCHNPVLMTDRLTGDYKPTRIIPFAYDKDKAIGKFLSWARKKRFVPKSFYSASQLEKITGLYIPYWMADTKAAIDLSGKGITRRTWMTGSMEYTETKEYKIERHGTIDIDHVNEIANRKMDKTLLDSITPFDETQAVDFSMTYLNGFFAEKYDISKDEVQPGIMDRAKSYVMSMLQETMASYNQVQMSQSDVAISVKGWDYALFPAWILTYLYKGKTYVYAINGQNGKSFGELPVDSKKLGLVSVLVAVGLLLLMILGGWLIW